MYFLGIDAGGTSSKARIEDFSGNTLGAGIGGPANTMRGHEDVLDSLVAASMSTFSDAKLNFNLEKEISICIGIAGYLRTDVIDRIYSNSFFKSFKCLLIVSDAEIANQGAHSGKDGAIICVGTGSIGFAKVNNRTFQIGGRGFPASDLGSGAHIGLKATQHYLQVFDGMLAKSAFSEDISNVLGDSPEDISAWITRLNPTEFAKLAPMVIRHANLKNKVAESILKQGISDITDFLCAIKRLGVHRISLTGGLAQAYHNLLDRELQTLISDPEGDPIDGAISLARSNYMRTHTS